MSSRTTSGESGSSRKRTRESSSEAEDWDPFKMAKSLPEGTVRTPSKAKPSSPVRSKVEVAPVPPLELGGCECQLAQSPLVSC